jgi:ribosomal protein S18 acetylase RimI-like enzyme
MNLEYHVEIISQNQIRDILISFDNMFTPPLSSIVELSSYANKLGSSAKFVTCRHNNMIVGVIAYYSNDITQQIYIPYICVDRLYQGNGIAKNLFNFLEDNICHDYKEMVLEVRKTNLVAYNLYLTLGFTIKECEGEKFLMSKSLLS